MEHDMKCERVGTARAIAAKVNLTRGEFHALTDKFSCPFGIACLCYERRESKFGWATIEKREVRDRTIQFVLKARQARQSSPNMIINPEFEVSTLGWGRGRQAGKETEGRVIRVDFRNRRKLD